MLALAAAIRGVVVMWYQRSASSPAYFSAKMRLASDYSSVDNHTFAYTVGALAFVVRLAFEVAFEVAFVAEVLSLRLGR